MDILIIDDDEIDRMRIARNLQYTGLNFEIYEASTAIEGLKITNNMVFDLILLDYSLPSMNGIEFLERFKKRTENSSAVVVLSHSDDDDLALACIKSGAQDFINKNEITVSRLKRAMQHAAERARLESTLRRTQTQLRHLAEVDALTGLKNRSVLYNSIDNAIQLTGQGVTTIALLVLEINRFKQINEIFGPVVGDQLLIEIAERLRRIVGENDVLCCVAGDQFAVLMQESDEIKTAQQLSRYILEELHHPFSIEGHQITVSVSIGIAGYSKSVHNSFDLVKFAYKAKEEAKGCNREQVHYFSRSMQIQMENEAQLERELIEALEGNELVVRYQAQFDGDRHNMVGFSAKLFWRHNVHGLLAPERYMSIAKKIGVEEKVGIVLIEQVCIQLEYWREQANICNLSVQLPLSLKVLVSDKINILLKTYRIPVECFTFEISQQELARCAALSEQLINQLSEYKLCLSLDDFDKNKISFFCFRQPPIHTLIIDKVVVQRQFEMVDSRPFISAIAAFSSAINYRIAMRNFNPDELQRYFADLPVAFYQGDEFSPYLTAKAFEQGFG